MTNGTDFLYYLLLIGNYREAPGFKWVLVEERRVENLVSKLSYNYTQNSNWTRVLDAVNLLLI